MKKIISYSNFYLDVLLFFGIIENIEITSIKYLYMRRFAKEKSSISKLERDFFCIFLITSHRTAALFSL